MKPEHLSLSQIPCVVSQARLVRLERVVRKSSILTYLWGFASLTVLGQQPAFVSQPQSEQVSVGASFALTAGVTGGEPLTYEWLKNGRAIPSATSPDLQFSDVSPTDTGSYSLIVRNAFGSAISQTARVEVNALSATVRPIPLTGWNQSVILDNSPFPFVTADFDTFGQFWFEAGWQGHSDGLPSSGRFTSQFSTNVMFKFQSYESFNVLRLDNSSGNSTGILVLTTPAPYHSLAVLASSGNGGGNGRLTLNFTDGTSTSNLSFVARDWYDFSTNLAIAGLARDHTSGAPQGYQNAGTGFGMFETDFDLRALGVNNKFLKSITLAKAPGASVTGIFAVSGEANLSARFRSISLLADGRVQLILLGFPSVIYRIDSSTNLANWVPANNVSSPTGISQMIDATAIGKGRMFYRAIAASGG